TATDTGAMLQQLGGSARVTIPYAPIGLPVAPAGPDPTLSVADGQWMVNGGKGTLLVPVNIDTARPEGSSGMVDAALALTYDPKLFEVSASDVQLGSVTMAGSGWQLQTEVNPQSGLIGLELYSKMPIASQAGRNLVTIELHLRDSVPALPSTSALTIQPY